MNIRLEIEYDGTRYAGWQRQKNGQNTIQGKIEAVLSKRFDKEVEIHGAGRTDAGVHAKGQVANFHCPEGTSPDELRTYMNQYLPEDIRIKKAVEAGERFHSRLNATGKVYEYLLIKNGCTDVFIRNFAFYLDKKMDVPAMVKAAGMLEGEHDFASYCTKASKKKSTKRRMDAITIEEDDSHIKLRFEGNGFLYNMVRILVGTLIEVGEGTRTLEEIHKSLQENDRKLAGVTAPAKGLTLVQVKYD